MAVPHIKIRRVPKRFMQESPVLEETFRVNSSAGPSGPRGRRDCNTGKQLPLCMNQHKQSMRARRREYEQRCKRCKRGNMFHIASPCGPAVYTQVHASHRPQQHRTSNSGSGRLGSSMLLPPPRGPRLDHRRDPKDGDRSSALVTLIPATIWQ